MTKSSKSVHAGSSGGGAVYGLGLIGAAVYYWQQANGAWDHVLALGQAILWPAFVVYDLLGHIS